MDSAISKIHKLLALAESSNEHEAKNAMLKVQELLVKSKLSMEDVNEYKPQEIEIVTEITDITFTKAKWKAHLAELISDNFCCYHYFKRKKSNRVVFVGKKEDVYVCKLIYVYAIDTIQSSVKSLQYHLYKRGISSKGLESDYALGFITGLKVSFDKQKAKNLEWGLVLTKDISLTEEFNSLKFSGSMNNNVKYNGFSQAFSRGKKNGENFSISNKIADENSRESTTELLK